MSNDTVARLNVALDMRLNDLEASIKTANARVASMSRKMHSDIAGAAKKMNAALSTIGLGLSAGAVIAYGKSILELGGKINDLSLQAGISTDAFQTFQLVAMDSGVTGEQIAQAFVHMRKSIEEAASGSATAAKSFETLKLSAAALKQLAPDQSFELIAQRIAGATDKSAAFNAALDILGAKTAPKLTEVLNRLGVEGFAKLNEEVKNFKLTPEQIKSIDDAGDKLNKLLLKMKLVGANLMSPLADDNAFQAALARDRKAREAGLIGKDQISSPEIDKQAEQILNERKYEEANQKAEQLIATNETLKVQNDEIAAAGKAFIAAEKVRMDNEFTAADKRRKYNAEELAAIDAKAQSQKELEELFNGTATFFDEKTDQIAKAMDGIWENSADNAASAFADMVLEGEASFDKIASSFARMVIEMAAKWAIMKGLEAVGLVSSGAGAIAGARAEGGPVTGGSTYLVGENGPELFTPKASGMITSNAQLTSTSGGSGDIDIHIDATGADAAGLRRVEAAIRDLDRNFASRARASVSDGRMRGDRI